MSCTCFYSTGESEAVQRVVRFVRTSPTFVALPVGAAVPPPTFSGNHSVPSPFSRDWCSTLVPWDVVNVGAASYWAKVDRFLAEGSVKTWGIKQKSLLVFWTFCAHYSSELWWLEGCSGFNLQIWHITDFSQPVLVHNLALPKFLVLLA